MPYDIVADARALDALSDAICEVVKRTGKREFIERYYSDPDAEGRNPVRMCVNSYVEDKRRVTLAVLEFPHKYAAITTTDRKAERVIGRIGRGQPLPADEIVQPLVGQDKKAYEDFGLQ